MKRSSFMKGLGTVALAAVLSMGLCACSGGDSSEADANKTSEPASQPATTDDDAQGDAAAEPVKLQVFAANSLTKAMDEAQALYTQQTGVEFADTQYEASGTLNEMLGAGQYADILITASKSTMDDATEAGYVKSDTNKTMFTNQLVIVTKEGGELAGTEVTLDDIAAGKYTLSVGDENVPAGNYAAQSLSTVGAYTEPDGTVGAEASGKEGTWSETLLPKITFGGKVGDVCKYAETGEVDIAMVYTSDVYRMGGVSICSVVPDDTHKAITYPGAVCTDSQNAEAAQAFLDWCMTDEDCAKIWQEWGFELA